MGKYLVGVDVGGTNIKLALMTRALEPVAFTSFPTRVEDGYDRISQQMIRQIEKLVSENDVSPDEIAAIGMGLPGTVDTVRQKTVYLSILQWDDMNPCEKLGEYFHVPCRIENDANLNALGEYHFTFHREIDNMVLLTLGTGIGSGIILRGRLYGGTSNHGAELGHMTIVADGGRTCLCGRPGHWEAYCSGTALERYVAQRLADFPDSLLHREIAAAGRYDNRQLFQCLQQGDPLAQETFSQFLRYLAVGIANVMKILAPDLIVLGGGLSQAGEVLFSPLEGEVRKHLIDPGQFCPIVPAQLNVRAGAYGACVLASEAL